MCYYGKSCFVCMRFIQNLKYICPTEPTLQDAKDVCAAHNYSHIVPILKAISEQKTNEVYWRLMKLWQDGMSFEDILHAVQQTTDLYFMLPSESQERLYRFLVTGWAYHAQSRCNFLDLLCCSQEAGLFKNL